MQLSIRAFSVAALLALGAAPAAGPALPSFGGSPDSTVVADTTTVNGLTPSGAFLRSVLVPGWGHASIGSHRRGAFYVAAQGGTGWMLLRIRKRLQSATSQLDIVETDARARLALAGIVDAGEVTDSLQFDPSVGQARGLVEARKQQREDWIALGVFLMLLGGADAFVSAHLADFPAEPVFNAAENGRVDVGIRIPVGGGGP